MRELEQLERLRSEIPPAAPWLPILVIHIRSQVKTRQSQSYKFKKIAKNPNFQILPETLHATHLLKLLDKMYEYEMDPTKTVGATERTRDAGRTDGQTDGRSETSIPPNNFVVRGGYNDNKFNSTKSLRVYYWYVKTPTCRYIEYGLKDVKHYVHKHMAPQAIYYTPH